MSESVAPVVSRLHRARGQHEATVRWVQRVAPVLLVAFVAAAFLGRPAPGLAGTPLLVTLAVVAFPVGVLGRNATVKRVDLRHVPFVVLTLVASLTLVVVQPDGPGVAGLLVGVLFVAVLLPTRVAVPLLVVSFVGVLAAAWAAGRADLAVLGVLGGFYGVMFLAFRLNEAGKRAERLLAELRASQEAQARAAGLAERQHLAREMHDVLAHSLSGLVLQLEGARMLAARDGGGPRLAEVLDRALHLGRDGLDEARRAIGTLRDDDLPGPERLDDLATRFAHDHGVPCVLTVTGPPRDLGSEARLAVYRVAQEALTNVARHARPDRVAVGLAYEPACVRLTVEDVGTPPGPGSDGGGGYGLTGMRERAELLGGTLSAAPTPGGFLVALEVPA